MSEKYTLQAQGHTIENELISIVIPTYNRVNYLVETLESAINQTYNNTEIIIIDDGSTDETQKIVEPYIVANRNIRYIYKANGGIASALNEGIKNMKGEWFKWLSSDDVLLPNALESLMKFANERQARIVYSDYMKIDEQGNRLENFIEPTYIDYFEFAGDLLNRFIGNGSSSLINKSVFDRVGTFNDAFRIGEDYEFWLRACIVHGIMFHRCPEILLKYRVHAKQTDKMVQINTLKNDDRIRDSIKELFINVNGEDDWKDFVDMLKRKGKIRPLWRRTARRFLNTLPEGLRRPIVGVYLGYKEAKIIELDNTLHDLEWLNPLLDSTSNNARCHFKRYEYATEFCKDKNVLDLACGCGYGSRIVSSLANFVVAVDRNVKALELARSRYNNTNIEYITKDIVEFIIAMKQTPDVTICFEILEHLDRYDRALLIKSIQSKQLLISFPTPDYIHSSKFHYDDITITEVIDLLTMSGFVYDVRYQHQDGSMTRIHTNTQNYIITATKTN